MDLSYKPPFLITKSRWDIPDIFISQTPLNELFIQVRSALCAGGRAGIFTLTPSGKGPNVPFKGTHLNQVCQVDPDGELDSLIAQAEICIRRLPPELQEARFREVIHRLKLNLPLEIEKNS